MKIKFLLPLLVILATGCSSKDDSPKEDPSGPALSVSKSDLSFGSDAASETVTVKSSAKPSVLSNSTDWLTASSGAFSNYSTEVTVTVTANTTYRERTGYISVTCGTENVKINVKQEANQDPEPDPTAFLDEVTPLDNDAWKVSQMLGLGWNLGNQMDANTNGVSSETCWGNPKVTQATFDALKAKGFKSVRIPVTWMGHIGDAPDYKVDEEWLNRVFEIVGYAKKAGLNAIINTHHDGGDAKSWLNVLKASKSDADKKEISDRFAALWKQIAVKFADEGAYLIFEPFNELNDGSWGYGENLTDDGKQYAVVNEWNQLFVNTVRAAGGENANRYLMVAGYCTNAQFAIDYLTLPTDTVKDRIIVTVHCYDPWEYTINYTYQEWGHTGAAGKKPAEGEKEFVENYAKLKAKYLDNNIPVCVGECGLSNRSDERGRAFEKYYLEFTVHTAKIYGMSTFLWDNGVVGSEKEADGFIHHGTGEYINNSEPMISAMNKAFYNTSSDYTLRSIYDGAPK